MDHRNQGQNRYGDDVAVAAGIDPNRRAILENGELTASDAEIDAPAEVLMVLGNPLSNK